MREERVGKGAKYVFFAFTTSEIYAMIKAAGPQGGGSGKGRAAAAQPIIPVNAPPDGFRLKSRKETASARRKRRK